MAAYYNEIDPYAAQWLRNLIAAGHIAAGDVDERSIEDVQPDDIVGYRQCHFFAGIGGWSHALRLAGWPDDRPVWTGSCPCQPFSAAGRRHGVDDERHLWPEWCRLIGERKPPVVFGEQVEAAVKHGWLDLVYNDLEGLGYAVGAAVLPAASVGAPHIRHRLWFVADADHERCEGQHTLLRTEETGRLAAGISEIAGRGRTGELGNSGGQGLEGFGDGHQTQVGRDTAAGSATSASEPGRASPVRAQGEHGPGLADAHRVRQHGAGPTNGCWRATDWFLCRDGRWRPVEPGACPLADGAAGRVGRLRAYGNAIVPQVAAEVIGAYMDYKMEQVT